MLLFEVKYDFIVVHRDANMLSMMKEDYLLNESKDQRHIPSACL